MPFAKGVSGNPGGRPKSGMAISDYVRKLGGPDGRKYVDLVHSIALDTSQATRDRLAALNMLMDRGWNKPTIGVEIDAPQVPLFAPGFAVQVAPVLEDAPESDTIN